MKFYYMGPNNFEKRTHFNLNMCIIYFNTQDIAENFKIDINFLLSGSTFHFT